MLTSVIQKYNSYTTAPGRIAAQNRDNSCGCMQAINTRQTQITYHRPDGTIKGAR